jgi:hypothetical protein
MTRVHAAHRWQEILLAHVTLFSIIVVRLQHSDPSEHGLLQSERNGIMLICADDDPC